MYICVCFGVTDKQIRDVVREHGAGNMREVRQKLELGSQCGKCVQMTQNIIDTTIIDESLFKEVG